jgi:hypothetical protein
MDNENEKNKKRKIGELTANAAGQILSQEDLLPPVEDINSSTDIFVGLVQQSTALSDLPMEEITNFAIKQFQDYKSIYFQVKEKSTNFENLKLKLATKSYPAYISNL